MDHLTGTKLYGDYSEADLCQSCGNRIRPGHTFCGRCAHAQRQAAAAEEAARRRRINHLIYVTCREFGLPQRRGAGG